MLVRADDGADAVEGDVVLGLELHDQADDSLLAFAFEAASRRGAALRIVHGWRLPAYPDVLSAGTDEREVLDALLRPWREKYPTVEVTGEAVVGGAGPHLVDASRNAALVVVGHRGSHASAVGSVGPVTQEVVRHAVAPVAVVPHG
ncbi:universal stress protein [Streptomyces sp. CdTB01]|uniref:universal stress protein n=1 Tax=Streptomyces sp. CdTB01 TaxID=1725411 RepID=UPI0031BADF0B